METKHTQEVLREMLKDQVHCMGRIFARHKVPDDVIWEMVKAFDLIYLKIKRQTEDIEEANPVDSQFYKMEPHPGIMHLLDKIDKYYK